MLAVTIEAFGIALLLPVLELIVTGDSAMAGEPGRLSLILQRLLERLGIAESVTGIMLLIVGVILLKGGVRFLEGTYKAVLSANLLREIKGKLFDQYSGMDYSWYTTRNTGHFVNLISVQVNRLLHTFESYKRFLSELIVTAVYLVFAFIISWTFALMAAVAGLAVLLLFQRLNRYARRLSDQASDEYSTLYRQLVQSLQSFPYLAATGQTGIAGKRVIQSIFRLTGYYRNQLIALSLTRALREPIAITLVFGIVIIQLTLLDALLAPTLVSLLLIYRAMGHVMSIQSSWQQVMNMAGGLEMVEKELQEVDRNQEPRGDRSIGPFNGEIRLREVSLTYPTRKEPAVKGLDISIPAKSTIALFGPSGSGKSTVVNLVTLLLRPDHGVLTIDGIPHDQLDPVSWRRQIGYVPQEPVFFDDTIARNITFSDESGVDTTERMRTAARRAGALEFITPLSLGFNTVIGDRGVRLSGGQKQRLAIAREIYKNPAVLVLDEATSALDRAMEQEVRKSLRNLQGEVTLIIVTHRVSVIRDADRIYLFDKGRITASGTFEELRVSHPELNENPY